MFTNVALPVTGISFQPEDVQEIICHKSEGRWYISLAQLVPHNNAPVCSEIATSSDDLIDWIARRKDRFTVQLHTLPFAGAGELVLDELCTGPMGGAYYRITSRRSGEMRRLWICDTSLLVFGDLPPRIFYRRGRS